MNAVADTGAQTCSVGATELEKAWPGMKQWLLKTAHRICGVTNDNLKIMGALLLKISYKNTSTTEVVYVCNNTNGFYLSDTALRNLQLIPATWPNSEHDESSTVSATTNGPSKEKRLDNGKAACGCPKRAASPPLPSKIPHLPSDENRGALEKWIVEYFAASAFNTCTHQPMQKMAGDALKISFREDAVPHIAHCPIQVPFHWKQAVKEKLDADVRLGIIEEVPAGVPTTWCARMVTVPKKDGTPRRTVDLKKLNDATHRETHHTSPPFVQVNLVPRNQKKTILDAWNGYHGVELSEEAREATTFITEWGRYRYCRAPMGFHGSNDGYTKRFDNITAGFPRVTRCIDDSLLWDDSIEDSFWHTLDYIKICSDKGIVFNKEKFKFARDTIEFAGFEVTNEGYRPPDRILSAIRDFPTPKSITDIRSWYGLVHQVAYAFAQAPIMAPFRELLSKKRSFYWDENLSLIFEASKEKIVSEVKKGVKTFEVKKPTCLFTDWSRTGMGFVLTQKQCDCKGEDPQCGDGHWNLIFAGSRFLKDAETRYAPIEGEAVALIHGLEACRMFTMGCPTFIVAVDHKPLIKIFNDKNLEDIKNIRLLKCREKAMMYSFKTVHIPGKRNLGADATSRYPTMNALESVIDESSVVATMIAGLEDAKTPLSWKIIHDETLQDAESQALVEVIVNGFPSKEELAHYLVPFWRMRDDLYIVDSVPIKDGKVLIPKALRSITLEALHEGHQGINAMLSNARSRFFWPGMSSQLRQLKNGCQRCREIAPSLSKEPMLSAIQPTRPFQYVASDIFDMAGHLYLVYVDRYSGWIEVAYCNKTDTSTIKKAFRKWFITFGVPEELSCDGGPQYISKELRDFLNTWGVKMRQSSAYYPQSNGRAEAAVKSMKRFLTSSIGTNGSLDNNKAARVLLLQRNTPLHESDLSPAEILYGRPIRDHLPRIGDIRNEWKDISVTREREFANRTLKNTEAYNKHASTQKTPLSVGESVAVQDNVNGKKRWLQTGVVVESNPDIRQYLVRVDGSNRVTHRNRLHLRPIDERCPYSGPQQILAKPTSERAGITLHTPVEVTDGIVPGTRDNVTSTLTVDSELSVAVPAAVPTVAPGSDIEHQTALPVASAITALERVPRTSNTPSRRSCRIRKPVIKLNL